MKRILALSLAFTSVSFVWEAPALACADNEYESCFLGVCGCLLKVNVPTIPTPPPIDLPKIILNPMDYIDPTGLPTVGDFSEFVVKNPDAIIELASNPGQWPYYPVAQGIISSRNSVVNGGQHMPEDILQKLKPWYDETLMRSVRWTSNWGPLNSTLQAAQMAFKPDTQAITVMNGVVFRSDALARDPVLWAHELYHVQEYRDWGVFEFARKWVNNSTDSGEVEAPAYRREDEVELALARGGGASGRTGRGSGTGSNGSWPPPPPPQQMGSVCVTQTISCPWIIVPKGWSCSCPSPYGLQFGMVQ